MLLTWLHQYRVIQTDTTKKNHTSVAVDLNGVFVLTAEYQKYGIPLRYWYLLIH